MKPGDDIYHPALFYDRTKEFYRQERSDNIIPAARHSAYSYEDLPSDKLGAEFGANYFNPNSKLSLGEQRKLYLDNLGATLPQNAPNYETMPLTDENLGSRPSRTNTTTAPVFTKQNP